jgi:hypothetical protein
VASIAHLQDRLSRAQRNQAEEFCGRIGVVKKVALVQRSLAWAGNFDDKRLLVRAGRPTF